MSETALPTEIELIYEIMPCADVHSVTHQGKPPLPCSYFRKWGTYHSFDYEAEQPIPTGGILQKSVYAGREPLVAEALSGCRKAAIMAVGINPNLPGWWKANSVNPLFNDNQQFAHYFRYRATAKLDIPMADYVAFGGGPADVPFSNFTLAVPTTLLGSRQSHSNSKKSRCTRTIRNYSLILPTRWAGPTISSRLARMCPMGIWSPALRLNG